MERSEKLFIFLSLGFGSATHCGEVFDDVTSTKASQGATINVNSNLNLKIKS